MTKVECKDCIHFKQAPYEAPRTGCYHPDNMKVKQKDAYLNQQQIPGDHERINLRGDCAQYEAKPAAQPLWKRMLGRLAS